MAHIVSQQEFLEHRAKESELAVALDEWKRFSILKFDEGNKRMEAIEGVQEKHFKVLETNTALTGELAGRLGNLERGIGDVLSVVTALSGTKKTLGWVGKALLWMAGVVGAIVAMKVGIAQAIKASWL